MAIQHLAGHGKAHAWVAEEGLSKYSRPLACSKQTNPAKQHNGLSAQRLSAHEDGGKGRERDCYLNLQSKSIFSRTSDRARHFQHRSTHGKAHAWVPMEIFSTHVSHGQVPNSGMF